MAKTKSSVENEKQRLLALNTEAAQTMCLKNLNCIKEATSSTLFSTTFPFLMYYHVSYVFF